MKDISELSEGETLAIRKLNLASENAAKAEDWGEAMRAARDEAIVELRRAGWTIADLADLAGLSESAVHKISMAGGIGRARPARKAPAKKAARKAAAR